MATYYVMEGGTAANIAAAVGGDVTDVSKYMSFSTMSSELSNMANGDIVEMNGYGGTITMGANFSLTTGQAWDDFTLRGDTQYPPTLNAANTYQIKSIAVDRTTYRDFKIINADVDGIGFETSGTGHVVRNVHIDGADNQAFQVEGTCEVTCYNITGSNCTDDGFSMHDNAVATIYGGNFYGNAEGINISYSATLTCHDVRCFGNGADVYISGADADGCSITMYDSEIGGGVVQGTHNSTESTLNFIRCKFHCNSIATTTFTPGAAIQSSQGNTTRVTHTNFDSCLFLQPPSGKAQVLLQLNATGSTATVRNCTFAQATKTNRGLFVTGTGAITIENNNFYNCTSAVTLPSPNTCTARNNNFDGNDNTYESSNTPEVVNTGGLAVSPSGFEQVGIEDYRLGSASSLIGAGTTRGANNTHDVENRPYSTDDVGCYADTAERPVTPGSRPS